MAGDGGDVDDVAAALAGHVGRDGLDAVDGAPEVGLEEVAGVFEVTVGDGGEEADTGVVDEDVDGVVLLDGAADERFD